MKVKMTLDIFSGRPNSTLEVSGTEAKKILEQLDVKSGADTDKNFLLICV